MSAPPWFHGNGTNRNKQLSIRMTACTVQLTAQKLTFTKVSTVKGGVNDATAKPPVGHGHGISSVRLERMTKNRSNTVADKANHMAGLKSLHFWLYTTVDNRSLLGLPTKQFVLNPLDFSSLATKILCMFAVSIQLDCGSRAMVHINGIKDIPS